MNKNIKKGRGRKTIDSGPNNDKLQLGKLCAQFQNI
jgi:hypothetical protein